MENNIDTRFIKFSGKAEVEKELTVGNNYSILSSGTVTAETLTDLHNGKFAKSYKWEVIQSEIIDVPRIYEDVRCNLKENNMKKVKTDVKDKIELHKGAQYVQTPNGVKLKKASAIKIGDVLDCCNGVVIAVGYDVCVVKKN